MEITKGQFPALVRLPLLWISVSFLAGIVAGKTLGLDQWILAFAIASLIFLILRKLVSRLQLVGLFCLAALFLGGARFQFAQPSLNTGDLAFYNDRVSIVTVHGWLNKPPVYQNTYVELWVTAERLEYSELGSIPISGSAIVRASLGSNWHYGDQVRVTGGLETPQNNEDFSFQDFLARNGVYSLVSFPQIQKAAEGRGVLFWQVLYGLLEKSAVLLARLFPDPEASLLAGILLGDESGLSDSLKSAFNETGTRHIIAISGFNISIIAGVVLAGFTRWLGIRRGLWLSGLAIVLYTLFVGAGASVVRAAIMAMLALLARQLGRDQFGLNTLAFVAAAMSAVNPYLLWDIGFQLSFSATLGLMVFAEPLRQKASQWLDAHVSTEWSERARKPLYEFVFMTIAAQITTLPLLLVYFHRISLVSLPANILVLPLQPALMILGSLSVLFGLLVFPLGQIFALAAWPLAALTIRLVEFFASFPIASSELGSFTAIHAIAYYVILLFISVPSLRSKFTLLRMRPAIPAAMLAVVTFAIWGRALGAPTGRLEITLLDVGGEAILLRTPAGRNLLINGGPSGIALSEELGRLLPGSARELEWIVVAGERPEQINGLIGRIDRLNFQQLAWATLQPPEEMLTLFQNVEAAGKPISRLQVGQTMDLGDGIGLQVLSVGQRGAILLLTMKNFQALFPLGLDFAQMDAYLQRDTVKTIDLLLLADSGYPPLNSADWIESIDPIALWLSADGELNPDVLASLGGRSVFSASELGWLRATTNGDQVWFSVEHATSNPPLIQP